MEELILTLMCGLPGSGKTHFVQNILVPKYGCPVVSPDAFRLLLTGQQFHGPAEDSVWSHAKSMARILLSQKINVIVDATNISQARRRVWIDIADSHGAQVSCHLLDPPIEDVHRMNMARSRYGRVPSDIIDGMVPRFERPVLSEGIRYMTTQEDHLREAEGNSS